MSRGVWVRFILVLGLLVGCVALAVNMKPNLGLDLRGGAQFIFEAEGTEQTPATAENVERRNMTALGISTREEEIAARQRAFEREEERYRDALNERRLEEVRKLKARADEAVRTVARDEQLDLVLQDVLFAGPRVDITARVLKLLSP